MTYFTATPDPTKGEPFVAGTIQYVRQYGDADRPEVSAGYWFVTPEDMPGPMTFEVPIDEVLLVLEGKMTWEVDGEVTELGPGASYSVNKGTTATVTILEPVVEFFVYTSS